MISSTKMIVIMTPGAATKAPIAPNNTNNSTIAIGIPTITPSMINNPFPNFFISNTSLIDCCLYNASLGGMKFQRFSKNTG